jgi:hypothetical protein
MSKITNKFSHEGRVRAVRMILDHGGIIGHLESLTGPPTS